MQFLLRHWLVKRRIAYIASFFCKVERSLHATRLLEGALPKIRPVRRMASKRGLELPPFRSDVRRLKSEHSSPILRLPLDLLQLICSCIHVYPRLHVLSFVCKAWRTAT